MFRIIFFSLLVFFCSLKAEDAIQPIEELYGDALIKIKHNKEKKAKEVLNKLILQYPFSELALKSEILLSYVDFKKKQYEDAIAGLESYLRYYTYNTSKENLDYIYYLLFLSYFQNMRANLMNLDYVQEVFELCNNLSQKVQNEDYLHDMRNKFAIVGDLLAEKIFNIGNFYFKRDNFEGAINRFDSIIFNQELEDSSYFCKAFGKILDIKDNDQFDIDIQKYENANDICTDNSRKLLTESSLENLDEESWMED